MQHIIQWHFPVLSYDMDNPYSKFSYHLSESCISRWRVGVYIEFIVYINSINITKEDDVDDWNSALKQERALIITIMRPKNGVVTSICKSVFKDCYGCSNDTFIIFYDTSNVDPGEDAEGSVLRVGVRFKSNSIDLYIDKQSFFYVDFMRPQNGWKMLHVNILLIVIGICIFGCAITFIVIYIYGCNNMKKVKNLKRTVATVRGVNMLILSENQW